MTADGSGDARIGVLCDGDDTDLCEGGRTECAAGAVSCNDDAASILDTCDGVDNDCDPTTADGVHDSRVGLSCDGDDADLCEDGMTSCVAGAISCSDDASVAPDICDGIDNDCDPSTADGSGDPSIGLPCDLSLIHI